MRDPVAVEVVASLSAAGVRWGNVDGVTHIAQALSRARTDARREGVEECIAHLSKMAEYRDWTRGGQRRYDDPDGSRAMREFEMFIEARESRDRALSLRQLLAAPEPGAASPAATDRCPFHSRAYLSRCELAAGHGGKCVSRGDAFAGGWDPTKNSDPLAHDTPKGKEGRSDAARDLDRDIDKGPRVCDPMEG